MADTAVIKLRQKDSWSAGEYLVIGATITMVGELLCEAVDLRSGQEVLDVATGTGNTALAAARRFCKVTGIDYVPRLLEQARKRAESEGLQVTFRKGDAENIPFQDASFDVMLSTFGCMFAPDQEKTASELIRVCRSKGKIGLANWVPDGMVGEVLSTSGKYVPPPSGLKPPTLWGTRERLEELFGNRVSSMQIIRRSFAFRYPSAEYWLQFNRTHLGPMSKTFEKLDEEGKNRLAEDLLAVVKRFNRSGDETIVATSDYLEIVAVKK
jgi:SAM-dependent methyltransferase